MKNAATSRLKAILILLNLGVAAFLFYWFFPVRRIPRHFGEQFPAMPQPFRSIAYELRFSPDGKYLLVAGRIRKGVLERPEDTELYALTEQFALYDERLRLFDVVKRKEIERLKAKPIFGQWNGVHMQLTPDFKTLITSWGARNMKVIEIRKRKPDQSIEFHNGYLGEMKVSPDGKILVLGMTGEVQIRDAKTFHLLRTYEHGGQGTSVDFGRSSHTIRCSWPGMRSHYVDTRTAKQVRVPYATREFDVTFSADGKYFAEIMGNDQVLVWQHGAKQNIKIGTVRSSLAGITSVQFSPDNKTLAVGGASSTDPPVQFYKLADIRKKNTS